MREELKKLKADIPVFASVDYYPQRKESHRMNTTVLEAYAAEPSRQTLKKVSDRFREHGAKFDLRVNMVGGSSGAHVRLTVGKQSFDLKPRRGDFTLVAEAKLDASTMVTPMRIALDLPQSASGAEAGLALDSLDISLPGCGGAQK